MLYKGEKLEDITMKQHFMMIVLSMFDEEYPTLKEVGEVVGCSYQNIKRMAESLKKKEGEGEIYDYFRYTFDISSDCINILEDIIFTL